MSQHLDEILSDRDSAIARAVAMLVRDELIGTSGLSSKQASDIALAAANTAVRETQASFFSLLGVNIADQKDLAHFRADIEFLRAMHSNSAAVGKRAMMFIVTAFLGGVLVAIWAGLKVALKQ